MIIIKLWGGLGNQMFQYAFGYCLAKENNDELGFDIKFYEKQPAYVGKRKVQLEKFFDLSNFHVVDRPKEVFFYENKYVNKVIRIFPGFHIKASSNVYFVKERSRRYMENVPYKKGKINYYDGYWLTSEYFANYEQEIRNLFVPRKEIRDVIRERYAKVSANSVAVHVRRGDYLGNHNMPGGYTEKTITDYYRRAIEYANQHITNPEFYFFSDDICWCKERLGKEINAVYVENDGEYAALLDMYGIQACQNGIISPSTFSWWGNWLRNESSMIIAPKGKYNNDRFLEKEWILL